MVVSCRIVKGVANGNTSYDDLWMLWNSRWIYHGKRHYAWRAVSLWQLRRREVGGTEWVSDSSSVGKRIALFMWGNVYNQSTTAMLHLLFDVPYWISGNWTTGYYLLLRLNNDIEIQKVFREIRGRLFILNHIWWQFAGLVNHPKLQIYQFCLFFELLLFLLTLF